VHVTLISLMLLSLGAPLSPDEILNGADARIEKHRRGDAEVKLIGPDDQIIAGGVKVRIEQTRHKFLFGSNIFKLGNCKTEADNQAYAKRYDELLNYATLHFYWWAYEKEKGKPAWDKTDAVVKWCEEHNIAMKGHPLAWNWTDPKWLPEDPARGMAAQFVRIERETKRFRGHVDIFDVVNEATHYNRQRAWDKSPKLTRAIYDMGVGPYVRKAFESARKGNPDATLVINDYVTDEGYAAKVLEELVDKNKKPLYDVIGIQSHQHGGALPVATIWQVCDRFARFGKPLHFTETTFLSGEIGWNVRDQKRKTDPKWVWASTPEGEKRQAEEVVRFYTILYSHPAVEAITWWDLTDQNAWQGAPCGLVRADMTPKPAYVELKKLIKGKWWTTTEATVDAGGVARFRGTYGDYKVIVALPDGEQVGTFSFDKSTKGTIEVRLK